MEWLISLAWVARTAETLYHRGGIADLQDSFYESGSASSVPLSVIVSALNEEDAIAACLQSLLASQGVRLEIFAVNDRSTDATSAIMDRVAHEAAMEAARDSEGSPHTLRVLHISQLPAGWLGKPHALAVAAAQASAPLLLFTDADALFAPDALARCLRLVEAEQADHLVLLPTAIYKNTGERMMLGAIQALSQFGVRLWKIAYPKAGDALGVGCFNLIRRECYEAIGGFAALRMEVVEDLRLGYLVKSHGFRQRVAFGQDLLRLHWAPGPLGIVHGFEKNYFELCRYRLLFFAGAFVGTALLTLAPFAGLLGPSACRLACVPALASIALFYAANARRSRVHPLYALVFPVAICLLLYGMARSALLTLVRGGVNWRGTLYPLKELRASAGPLFRR